MVFITLKLFLIFNKIISKTPFNFKLIQIPINLFIWFIIVILITFFIAIKKKNKNLYWISILYLGFICSYYLMLMLWSIKHNLINNDLELLVSWQRHTGSLLMGIIFLIIKFFQIYSSLKIMITILILSISMSLQFYKIIYAYRNYRKRIILGKKNQSKK